MVDLAGLDQLCAWMRSNGATSARVGELSLTLGPPPASLASVEQPTSSPDEPDDVERRDLETLLASSGADPEPILRLLRRSA